MRQSRNVLEVGCAVVLQRLLAAALAEVRVVVRVAGVHRGQCQLLGLAALLWIRVELAGYRFAGSLRHDRDFNRLQFNLQAVLTSHRLLLYGWFIP